MSCTINFILNRLYQIAQPLTRLTRTEISVLVLDLVGHVPRVLPCVLVTGETWEQG